MAEPIVLEHGPLEAVVWRDPFSLEIRRGRRLIRGLGLWAAAGESQDQFIQLTEGVIPAEELERPRRLGEVREAKAAEAGATEAGEAAAARSISLSGDLGSLRLELHDERLVLDFTAARTGLPIVRPLLLTDPADERGWSLSDQYGYGPALWVAPVLEDRAREREVSLPRGDWIDLWTGERHTGGGELLAPAPLDRIPVYVRSGSILVTYPAEHVAEGLGDLPERDRPLEATLYGEPRAGRAGARLADGTRIRWHEGEWSVEPERERRIRFGTAPLP